ncbi:MAG: YcaO-like family protein [Succinivibrionaceae bacterium]
MHDLLNKDAPLSSTIKYFTEELTELGLDLEFYNELNPGVNLYSCELHDKNNPTIIHTNGKGTSKEAAQASALGEMAERLLNQSFFDEYYLGKDVANATVSRYKDEIWVKYPKSLYEYKKSNKKGNNKETLNISKLLHLCDYYINSVNLKGNFFKNDKQSNFKPSIDHFVSEGFSEEEFETLKNIALPKELFNNKLKNELGLTFTIPFTDICTGNIDRGICAIPLTNEHTHEKAYFPVRYLEGCYCTNGMCAGNSEYEAKVQGLSEIFERFIRKFLYGQIEKHEFDGFINKNNKALPLIPKDFISNNFPSIQKTIDEFYNHGFSVKCYDASLGGIFPVVLVLVTKINSDEYKISLGSHPNMGVALERTLTELMQGVEWNTIYLKSFKNLHQKLIDNNTIDFYDPDIDYFDDDFIADKEHDDEIYDIDDFDDIDDCEPDSDDPIIDFKNFIKNFIDDSGTISYTFFTNDSQFKFVNWSFEENDTKKQYEHLLKILHKIGKNLWSYDVSYKHMHAYRLIVPNFSEIYRFNKDEYYTEIRDVSLAPKFLSGKSFNKKEFNDFIEMLIDINELTPVQKLGLINHKTNPYYDFSIDQLVDINILSRKPDFYLKQETNCLCNGNYLSSVINCSKLIYKHNFILSCNNSEDNNDTKIFRKILYTFYNKQFIEKCEKFVYSGKRISIFLDFGANFENFPVQNKLIETFKKLISM